MLTIEELAHLYSRQAHGIRNPVRGFDVGERVLPFELRPCLMGVINLSPDSWYRESVCLNVEQAVRRGKVLLAQGADLVDVGAESTLAHAERLDANRQIALLEPTIRELRRADVPVSVETYDRKVARMALESGATILNLTGPQHALDIYSLAADHDAAVIICFVQAGNVREAGDLTFAADPIEGMQEFFAREIENATSRGVRKVVIDPGLGFYYRNLQDSAARVRFQMQIFLNTFRLNRLGVPVCHALPHAFEYFGEEVRTAEAFFAVLAALGGTHLFRTHEVSRVRAVLETMAAWTSSTEKPPADKGKDMVH